MFKKLRQKLEESVDAASSAVGAVATSYKSPETTQVIFVDTH